MERFYTPGCAGAPAAERPPEPGRAPFAGDLRFERRLCSRIGWALFAMLAATIGLQLGLAYIIGRLAPGLAGRDWVTWLLSLAPAYLVGVPLCVLLMQRMPRSAPERRPLPCSWFRLFCIAACLMYAGNVLGLVVTSGISLLMGQSVTNPIAEMLTGSDLWVNALFTVVLAPVIEELVFRKLLMDRALRYGEATAVVMSGLLFGLYHGNFSQFFYAAFLGCLFAYVYARTGKLWITVSLHAAVNFIGGVLAPLAVAGAVPQVADGTAAAMLDPMFFVRGLCGLSVGFFLVCGAVGLVMLIKSVRRISFAPGEVQLPRRSGLPYGTAGMIALLAGCGGLFVIYTFFV